MTDGPKASRPVVMWGERAFPPEEGENVLGRDAGLAVTLDWPGVSRRHARIVLTGVRAILEDLGSKNGTFVAEKRLTAPRALAPGDTICLGRLLLMFHVPPTALSTRTEAEPG